MSGLTGKTKTVENVPGDVKGLRGEAVNYLLSSGLGQTQSPGTQVKPVDDAFFMENILKPYREMFEANRSSALAQGKESAGNLTGSGYNNILGSALARSLAEENAQLAGTRMGLRGQQQQFNLQEAGMQQQNQQFNAGNFLNMLMGLSTTGVGSPTQQYQPGFLDYALKAGQIAASALPFSSAGQINTSPQRGNQTQSGGR